MTQVSFKHERILAEGLQEDGQVQVEETKAGDKVGETHWRRQNTGRCYSHTARSNKTYHYGNI